MKQCCDNKYGWIALCTLILVMISWRVAIVVTGLIVLLALYSAICCSLDKDLERIKEEIKNKYQVH